MKPNRMEHSTIYKNRNEYASFPLLEKSGDRILIGFFTAPAPDHMGIFKWKTRISLDSGDSDVWLVPENSSYYDWPSVSPREISDRGSFQFGGKKMVTGSYGFGTFSSSGRITKITESKGLFIRSSNDDWKTADQRFYRIPTATVVLTFPRRLAPRNERDPIRLIPAYAVLKNGLNRALAWRSEDFGKTWQLYNMFPDEVNANETAFVWTEKGILAHIRSDDHPYIMESWSDDGIVWTYPTNVFAEDKNFSAVGGPPHLLRLDDGRILCSYGYRRPPMGIRAIVSDDGGYTWGRPIILRSDGGHLSSLHKRRLKNRFRLPHPGNDVGYPVSVQLDNDKILTAYYITNSDKITHIATTKWKVKEQSELDRQYENHSRN